MGMRNLRDKVSTPAAILGKEISVKGDIKGAGSIIISGQVEGNGDFEGLVEIASTAVWTGNIRTDDVVIAGTIKGDVFARGKLEITGSAKIFGNVSGTSVSVAQGAMIDGAMKIHDGSSLDEKASQLSEDLSAEQFEKASSF